jgi:hypothetical protein
LLTENADASDDRIVSANPLSFRDVYGTDGADGQIPNISRTEDDGDFDEALSLDGASIRLASAKS